MIDIDKIENEIKEIVETNETDTVTDFVLTPNNKTEIIEVEPTQVEVQYDTPEDEFTTDFEYIRNNIKDIINQGGEVLKHAISIAIMSETPRSIEVVATLMKAMTDANKDLLDSHLKKDNKQGVAQNKQTNIQNNTVFVGSTAELSKMMKDKLNAK